MFSNSALPFGGGNFGVQSYLSQNVDHLRRQNEKLESEVEKLTGQLDQAKEAKQQLYDRLLADTESTRGQCERKLAVWGMFILPTSN